MGKLFYIIGKSAAGKDTVYKKILETFPILKPLVTYTTRPMRPGEQEGVQYHFIDHDKMQELIQQGLVYEHREYHVSNGDTWEYATVRDDDFKLDGDDDYIAIGTLVSMRSLVEHVPSHKIVPIHVRCSAVERLRRAVEREHRSSHPDFEEVCRRFLSDEEDYSDDKLQHLPRSPIICDTELTDGVKMIMDEIAYTLSDSNVREIYLRYIKD